MYVHAALILLFAGSSYSIIFTHYSYLALPNLLSLELAMNKDSTLQLALDISWDLACDSYRNTCLSDDGIECVAKYDAREGILYAGTGSTDLVAGTTATVAALALNEDGIISQLVVLNCGDSRTLVVGEPVEGKRNYVRFKTRDHSPSCSKEGERLRANPNYSDPQCSMNKYWLTVGDYRYAVSRSLEGPLPTLKGITSESDIFIVNLADMASTMTHGMIIQASDGLFEVLDNEEVGRYAVETRKRGLSPTDCAHHLCDLAKKKGTSDNVTVTIVYLE
jgi:serine/threonine protein phosphatase PrpC